MVGVVLVIGRNIIKSCSIFFWKCKNINDELIIALNKYGNLRIIIYTIIRSVSALGGGYVMILMVIKRGDQRMQMK